MWAIRRPEGWYLSMDEPDGAGGRYAARRERGTLAGPFPERPWTFARREGAASRRGHPGGPRLRAWAAGGVHAATSEDIGLLAGPPPPPLPPPGRDDPPDLDPGGPPPPGDWPPGADARGIFVRKGGCWIAGARLWALWAAHPSEELPGPGDPGGWGPRRGWPMCEGALILVARYPELASPTALEAAGLLGREEALRTGPALAWAWARVLDGS